MQGLVGYSTSRIKVHVVVVCVWGIESLNVCVGGALEVIQSNHSLDAGSCNESCMGGTWQLRWLPRFGWAILQRADQNLAFQARFSVKQI